MRDDYGQLIARLDADGVDVARVLDALRGLSIEMRSWGYADSGTRFGTFPQQGRPRDVYERIDDAAEVHRLTGSARAVALYSGQDDFRTRRRRLLDSLSRLYAELPDEQELLIEYKFFEPAFYATDLPDWGSALLACQHLGERARVLVDLGHHAQGVNVEQIVAVLADEARLGGVHFNNRKCGDDDLIVGSVNPFELFLVFCELARLDGPLPRLTIDQAHDAEPKVEAMVLSVINLQEAYARALLVDRAARDDAQRRGDVLGGHQVLLDAYRTDVRPLATSGAPHRIRANSISPGLIVTPQIAHFFEDPSHPMHGMAAAHPLGRLGEPEDVARVALFLASDDAAYLNAVDIVVDGGQSVIV